MKRPPEAAEAAGTTRDPTAAGLNALNAVLNDPGPIPEPAELAPGATSDQLGPLAPLQYVHRARAANGRLLPGRPLNARQVSLIHVAKAQTGMGDAEYRELLLDFAGVRSSKDLTDKSFDVLMQYFAVLGFEYRPPGPRYGERPGMASQGQLLFIWRAWRKHARQPTEAALNHWLESHFHVTALRFVTADLAQKVIAGVKNMFAPRGSTSEKER